MEPQVLQIFVAGLSLGVGTGMAIMAIRRFLEER